LLDAVQSGLATANIPGGCHIAGLLWLQGEGDAGSDTAAPPYAARLAAFVTDFRAAVSEPNLPVVVAQIHTLPSWGYGNLIQEAEAGLPGVLPNVGTFETQDIPVPGPTNPHFDGPEQIEVGRRFAVTMLSLTAD
jgi:hypothetical protein